MLKKIIVLVICGFMTLASFADENMNLVTDDSVNDIWVKEHLQNFFVAPSQKSIVFRNATNKVMYFILMNLRNTSEGPVVVKCSQDDGTFQITNVSPGDSAFKCNAQYSVEISYKGIEGFASGVYHIMLVSP